MGSRSQLLTVDGVANLLFGFFLLASPRPLFEALGLPWTGRNLYATILGGGGRTVLWLLVLLLVGLSTAEMVTHRRMGAGP